MTRSSARLAWVDTGRGIAILLVALFHSTNWTALTGLDIAVWGDINTVLSSLRMPLFFVLSGLFAAKWLTSSWGSLLRVKVLLFLWVLVVWAVIGMTVQLLGLYVSGQPVNIAAGLRDVALAPVKPPFELWFIWALALFFVVAKATRKAPVVAQLVVAGLLSSVGLTVWLTTTTGLTGSAKFYFFFLCGLYLREFIIRFASTPFWIRGAVFAGWLVLSVVLFVLGLRELPGVYFVNCVVGVFAGVALSVAVTRLTLFGKLGKQTLPIYLAHTPLIILMTIAMIAIPVLTTWAEPVPWIVPPAVAALAVAGAVGLHASSGKSVFRYLYEPPPFAALSVAGRRR